MFEVIGNYNKKKVIGNSTKNAPLLLNIGILFEIS
jgi:hypothetical protein